jgi:HEPN domain-containing protein
MMDQKTKDMANGFLERASNKLQEAEEQEKHLHHAESVSAAQECIELSAKAAFLLLQGAYPKTHEFCEEQFETLLKKIPQDVAFHNFPRLYLLHRFWSAFYTTAKYGLEKLGAPAKTLFEKAEAELAIMHAKAWYYAVYHLRDALRAY